MADKIGERGEPCGVPWLRWMGSDLMPLKESCTCWSDRKDLIHWQRDGAKPRFWKMWMAQLMLMLSKKPWISKRMTEAMRPHLTAAWAWWVRHRAVSTTL